MSCVEAATLFVQDRIVKKEIPVEVEKVVLKDVPVPVEVSLSNAILSNSQPSKLKSIILIRN